MFMCLTAITLKSKTTTVGIDDGFSSKDISILLTFALAKLSKYRKRHLITVYKCTFILIQSKTLSNYEYKTQQTMPN